MDMGLAELFLVAVGLSMDACAAAICKGLSLRTLHARDAWCVGLYFGISQAVMPLAGCYLGRTFSGLVTQFGHWAAFLLLALIGGNMILESRSDHTEDCSSSLRFSSLAALALATSIDALAVGVTFAFLQVPILPAAALIGITTLLLSALGVTLGHRFGLKYRSRAELFGGVVLILIGLNLLLEHLRPLP